MISNMGFAGGGVCSGGTKDTNVFGVENRIFESLVVWSQMT